VLQGSIVVGIFQSFPDLVEFFQKFFGIFWNFPGLFVLSRNFLCFYCVPIYSMLKFTQPNRILDPFSVCFPRFDLLEQKTAAPAKYISPQSILHAALLRLDRKLFSIVLKNGGDINMKHRLIFFENLAFFFSLTALSPSKSNSKNQL
jgi:hypothetical protein